jgi:hypothetical protein
MHMPNTSPTESLLALFAGNDRAVAILGDLTEMAQTRGTLWFWSAYTRTLISLTWRIVLALVAATVGRQILVNSFHTYYMTHTPVAWRTTYAPFLLNYMGGLLPCIAQTLWFVLPFAAVRYGVRDRFVQLSFAVAVGTTVTLLYIPFASLFCAAATLAIAVTALFSTTWRKPLGVLLWTGAAGLLALFAVGAIDTIILSHHPDWQTGHFFPHYGGMLIYRSSLLAVAIVCSLLHRRLLEQPASTDRTLA